MKKNKKIILWLSSLGIVASPMAFLISCGSSESPMKILSGKVQTTKGGQAFAATLNKKANIKDIKGGASEFQFITKGGTAYQAELSSTIGSKGFPSLWTAANSIMAADYAKQNQLTKFKDPNYSLSGVAQDKAAEDFNKNLAGENVNNLIKALETKGHGDMLLKWRNKGDTNDWIVGFPSYLEAMGIIYNKNTFSDAGITFDFSAAPYANWAQDIYGTSAVETKKTITLNPIKDLDTLDKETQLLEHIKAVLNKQKANSVEKLIGLTMGGTSGSAFSEKVLVVSGISAAANDKGLTYKNPVIPGGDYSSWGQNTFTPKTAKELLFKDANSKGISGLKKAVEFFYNNKNTKKNSKYQENGQLIVGSILATPNGSWTDKYFKKNDMPSQDIQFLPLSLPGAGGKIAYDTSSYWIVSDQKNSNGRSESDAKAYRTQAINYLYNQYLTDEGQNNLVIQEASNPYAKNKQGLYDKHPLLKSANDYYEKGATIHWGGTFNTPGVGTLGYGRNNTTWIEKLESYYDNSTPNKLTEIGSEALKIWNK